MFDTLFSPITINKTVIKNRIVFPAMGLLYSLDQKLNSRYVDFYKERALGGAGIVVVGPVGIGEVGVGKAALAISSDEYIPDFVDLVQTIQQAGARAWIQLYHAGAYVRPLQVGGEQPIAPSALYYNWSRVTPRAMSKEDIRKVQQAFVDCAERAQRAGFDGVEIIASAGYLITQFLSPLRNHRTDEYGGSFENRVRFAREIIEQTRERLGPDYPITIRMAGNDFVPESGTALEIPEFARVYEQAGVDAISVTGGWHESKVPQLTAELPRGGFAYLAHNIKRQVKVPVMASNRIPDPYTAEKILFEGTADMVNLARVLVADPYWPQKAEQGRAEEICPCVACLQGCMDELFNFRPVACSVNPRAGYEGVRNIRPSENHQQVMVIGGGPAGMEAALRAAQAGHQVDLYEKSSRLGGQLWLAGAPPGKQEFWELIRYYEKALEVNGVKLHLNTLVDRDLIEKVQPDFIIAAEGAESNVPLLPGLESSQVVSAWEVLQGGVRLGQKIAIIGGGAVGLETAHFIANQGTLSPEQLYFLFRHEAESTERLRELVHRGNKSITVFELMPQIGQGVGKSSRWSLIDNLQRLGVSVITEARVNSVADGIVNYDQRGQQNSEAFDQVVLATGSRSVTKLRDYLSDCGIPYVAVGDSVRPEQVMQAVHGAFLAVMDNL